jgi:hypothetical protein
MVVLSLNQIGRSRPSSAGLALVVQSVPARLAGPMSLSKEHAAGTTAGKPEPANPFRKTRADALFDYPLPVPGETDYQKLGIEPDASDDDVRWALQRAKFGLEKEKKRIEASLSGVYEKVGLTAAYKQVEDLRRAGGEADPEALKHAQAKVAELEQRALDTMPEFRKQRERVAEIERRIPELNRLALDKPEQRLAYDREHPPLALLKVTGCARDEFLNSPRAIMILLRSELSQFLSARGEAVFHPSDITRDDYTADFTHYPLLDGED